MVTNHHEIGHTLFEDDPNLIARAMRYAGRDFPDLTDFEHLGTDLSTVEPVERRADRVIRFRTAEGKEGIFVIEVQLKKDLKKPASWGYYGMTLVNRYNVPVMIVVVTANAHCERWARDGFDFGHGLGDALHVRPLVLGPSTVRKVTDPAAARADPLYAALSVVVHRNDLDIDAILKTVAAGIAEAPENEKDEISNYIDLALGVSPAGTLWRSLMKLRADNLGPSFREILDEAVDKAVDKAVAEKEAEAAARVTGAKADFLLRYLEARSIQLSPEQRERIETCHDDALLDEWFNRALKGTSAAEVFVD